jgi:biopolymer transport protein ExbB
MAQVSSLGKSVETAERDLQSALAELAALRQTIAAEKIPLNEELRRLESRLSEVRTQYDGLSRAVDTGTLDLTNLEAEIKGREEEKRYLSNLLGEYVRNLETRVHISELQKYRAGFEAARAAEERDAVSPAEVNRVLALAVETSIDRLLDLGGGTRFEGSAVDADGKVRTGMFALVGPIALFRSADGGAVGFAEQRIGSLEPSLVPLPDPALTAEIAAIVASGVGQLPVDPSLGNARKIEETKETIVAHILKGGPVMIPILLMAFAALVVCLGKWAQISRVRTASPKEVDAVFAALDRGDLAKATARAEAIRGPVGEMLKSAVEHGSEPKELIEEIMFEKALQTRLQLQSFLPFIAMAASAAPLLGLLGTVTGMINTFKLITVFGSGDPKTLSSGISEALITTEYGLMVAIPSLLLYAYLSRRVKGVLDGMEKTAVAFLNRLAIARAARERETMRESA